MKVLITGGTGFIGSHVATTLVAWGHVPVIFDRTKRPAFTEKFSAYHFTGDVRDRGAVYEAVYHSDAVIHLAAQLGTQETIATARLVAENNILGSLNVFDACHDHDKRAVYIGVGNHWMNNPYSITKTCAERFAFMYNKERGTKIAVVRGLNAYGPGQKSKPVRKIMPNLILPALHDEPIVIYGDGTQVMDMIHVRDLADILCRALLHEHGVYDKVFEAGSGLDTTVNELAERVVDYVGQGNIIHADMRPGEIPNSVVKADPTTLEPLGWELIDAIPLNEGIPETVEWYRANHASS
jgi:UDP-glucose 4-epimerase